VRLAVDAVNRSGAHGLRAFGLLARGAFARETRHGVVWTIAKHVVLPIAAVCFFESLHLEVTRQGGWPVLAIAVAIWLLFANSVSEGGMVLWRERWLLADGRTGPWLVVASAATVPLAVFAVHIVLFEVALALFPVDEATGTTAGLALPTALTLATGLGVGVLAARICGVFPSLVAMLPSLLAASLLVTPVLYRMPSYGWPAAWCAINPICAAIGLARAAVSSAVPSFDTAPAIVASMVSGAILCWAVFVARLSSPSAGVPRV
jgi:ABC-type polysaccharide/polyol phosphate export permease